MIESLYIAETGMNSQQKLIEIISNNIANVNTPGFKGTNVNFVDLVNQSNNNGASQGVGVDAGKVFTNFSTGSLKQTGNPFDLAINGSGFLAIDQSNGEQVYTRAGRISIDKDGFLTSSQGLRLSDNIQIPPDATELTFTASGSVLTRIDGDPQLIEVGQIKLVNFSNTQGLKQVGHNLFLATEDAGNMNIDKPGESGTGQIIQGFTELSNVSMNEEMVNLMLAQRGYQLNARIIQTSDQIMETINNLRR